MDPWLLSQIIIQNTAALEPLVAVQSVYMHPFSLAKMVSSLSYLHNRRLCLNMVAGGFKNDLAALDDMTPHDRRYDRVVEYTTIIQRLLAAALRFPMKESSTGLTSSVSSPLCERSCFRSSPCPVLRMPDWQPHRHSARFP